MNNALREFFLKCPSFEKLKKLGIDMLSKDANVASIDKTPIKPIIKTYIDGSTLRQASFTIRVNLEHVDEIKQKIENSEFFEEVSDWIEEQNELGIFPILKGDKTVTKITISSSDYLVSMNPNLRKAYYQIQIIIEYEKKNTKNPFADFF